MKPTQVTLELDWSDGRIAGLIGLARLPTRPFSGYIELMAALEATRPQAADRGATEPGFRPRGTTTQDEEDSQ